jgi:hypothetical protein
MSTFREDEIITKRLVIEGVCSLSASVGTSGSPDRLEIKSLAGAMEVEILPADDFDKPSRIMSQIQLHGRNRGGWRKRGDVTVFNDSQGGEALYIGSSTTSGAPAGEVGMPIVHRLYGEQEEVAIDVVFHPSDNSIELKDYKFVNADGTIGLFTRKTIPQWLGIE